MSSLKRFPFFLRITPQFISNKPNSQCYLSQTIYSSLSYAEDADYRIISPIYPCDTILLSPSKTIKGTVLNKKIILKDDLYQYHLNHLGDTHAIQFSFVFNELLSNSFVYQKLIEHNHSSSISSSSTSGNQNVFIYGRQRITFSSVILTEVFKTYREFKLSFYVFDFEKKEKRLVKETMKNISIKNINDILSYLKNMKTEYKLSKINIESDEDNKMHNSNMHNNYYSQSNSNECLIISVSYSKTTMNLIQMNISNNDKLNDAQVLLQCGFDYCSSFIMNITEQSVESTEMISKFNYLYSNQDSLIKLPLVKLLFTNKAIANSINTLPNNQSSRNSNKVLSPIVRTESNDQRNEDLNDSMLFEEQPISSHIYQTPQHTRMTLVDKDIGINLGLTDKNNEQDKKNDNSNANDNDNSNSLIDQKTTNLSKLLEAEKREKLSLMIEVKCLKKKIESQESSLQHKTDQIDQLIVDKSSLEIEMSELKKKYNQLYDEYIISEDNYSKLSKKQEHNFTEIEEKISKFDSELSSFQKENSKMNQINSKQLAEINKLKNEKEQLYLKYKSSKLQIDRLGNKLNQIEAEFIKLSANHPHSNHLLSLSSNDDGYSNGNRNDDHIKNKTQREYVIDDLRNKITKYHLIK